MLTQIDIEELVERCRSKNARAYIREAVDSYRIGAYRACIITTWIALVYDLIDKFRELAFTGDKAAEKLVKQFDDIQKKRDTEAALIFERDVLRIAKDEYELISVQEHADLARLFDDRNRCGHPNLNRESEVYSPPPELARLHLRVAVEHVLERPPVQGKTAIGILLQTVDSEFFPISIEEAQQVLKATPLVRAKRNLVRDFVIGGLISLMREPLTPKKRNQRLAAIRAAQRMHPDPTKEILAEKFDEAVFKSTDPTLNNILWLLVACPDYQSLIKEATLIRLQNFVRDMPVQYADALVDALHIEPLRNLALVRMEAWSEVELSGMVSGLLSKPPPEFIDKCIAVYSKALNWNHANSMAKTLTVPLIKYASKEQATALIASGKNGEVEGSFEYYTVATAIKQSGLFTPEEFTAIVKENGMESRLSSLISEST